ncbi:MAG: hypothetical protein GEU98_03035 [Pseudonocardiaceae bacterium]|nr:hypothetical protein [Pseudonocardiaceae bacterium]
MRLDVLEHGHRLRVRLFLSMTARLSGVEMADVAKTLLYRPEFFGRAMVALSAEMMRGPSFWTAGEREYLALYTARLHRCPFCIDSHAEMTRIASAGEIDPDDPGSARPELTAVLGFVEKVTRTPEQVRAPDLDGVRAAGVPDAAVVQALHVNLIWNVVNRFGNAFGFELREGQLEKGTRALHRLGYRFPGLLTHGKGRVEERSVTAELERAVFGSPAETEPAIRRAAATGDPLPERWEPYAATVRDASYRVTNDDIDRLLAAGHSEDAIFEITVCAAVGAALRSLDAGLRAMRGESEKSP